MFQNIRCYFPYIFCLLIVASLFLFYTAYDKKSRSLEFSKLSAVLTFQDAHTSLLEINKVLALAAIALITFAFILGPLSRFWPDLFGKYLYFRKPVGLIGFALGLIHGAYSFVEFYKLDAKILVESEKSLAAVLGILGTFVFFLMSITSTRFAVQKMGYKNWKALQTFGYFGLFVIILHFFLIESKPQIGFDVRPYGLVFFYLTIAALVLRVVLIFIRKEPKKSYGEHFGDNKQ